MSEARVARASSDIGKRLKITRERVRQIEKIALKKLHKRLVKRNEEE